VLLLAVYKGWGCFDSVLLSRLNEVVRIGSLISFVAALKRRKGGFLGGDFIHVLKDVARMKNGKE
jgi:hypothetical protein